MNNSNNQKHAGKTRRMRPGLLPLVGATAFAVFAPAGQADTIKLSNQPLATMPTVQAKPNLLFVLDDSGSMDSEYMPDEMNATGRYGYRSAQCNGVAYDPSQTYALPIDSTGAPYPAASFTNAKDDGFVTGSSTTNLGQSSDYGYYYVYNGNNGVKQPKMNWVYTKDGVVSNTFYSECRTSTSNPSSLFTKVTVTSSSAEAQNYANWYSYYRKRALLMRTAMGRAISALDSNYRVGFSTISDTQAVDAGTSTTKTFRDVKDFDSVQKEAFYKSLYRAKPSGYTPLRGALAKAGLYYANKAKGQNYDPMQYSCQRNYTLLSTDGYWNTENESSTYGPFKLDGTSQVGNQDGELARPYKDDAATTVTTKTKFTAAATRTKTSSTQTRTIPWTKTVVTVGPRGTVSGGSNSTSNCVRNNYYLVTTHKYSATETQTKKTVTPQTSTSSYTTTEVIVDGGTPTVTQTDPVFGNWTDGTVSTVVTDTGSSATLSATTPLQPPDSQFTLNSGSPTLKCTNSPDTAETKYVQGSATNFSPSNVTYSNSTESVGQYQAGRPEVTTVVDQGSFNSLADVAQYYYNTDLRPDSKSCTSSSSGSSQDVCQNIVRPITGDSATWQHMNTFTIGLGVSGTLPYDQAYLTQSAGSYVDLIAGKLNWPKPEESSGGGDATNVDDLWHAAVNGRGQYYSALSASALNEAITGVVTSVQQVAGSASAASTSSLELVSGNGNRVFKASYTTSLWTGDIEAFTLKDTDATIGTTHLWSAQEELDKVAASDRKIYFNSGGALKDFIYGNLDSTQKGYFDNLCSKTTVASQCSTLSTDTSTRTTSIKDMANSGSNLVNFLRGDRTYESTTSDSAGTITALYRKRTNVLGDIINGAPVHVAAPAFAYADPGYSTFASQNSKRQAVVYAGGNDGMLHAFSAETGKELWAFIPTEVMPNLYKLADASYSARHQYFVDGAPMTGDIKVGTTWKTILVGGLNNGGNGYYALDITDPGTEVAPAAPKLLWEFKDANLGRTYGNPIITKRKDGTWVVVFASGYNNADGVGRLFVLNASTGEKLLEIATTAGSADTPSGLAKINTWIDSATDNTSKRFYGGDILGNLWRFDVDSLVEPHQGALLLATFKDALGSAQPITTMPQTAEVSGQPVIIVGTGRYLDSTDISDKKQQSIYAVKDTMNNSGWGNVRLDTTNFVQQTFELAYDPDTKKPVSASVSDKKVDWSTQGGWWIDLPQAGERLTTNLGLQYSTLVLGTTLPSGDACASGGSSWRYYLDIANGGVVNDNPAGILWSSSALIVGMSWVKDTQGNVRIIYQRSDSTFGQDTPPTKRSEGSGSMRRTSWRELTD